MAEEQTADPGKVVAALAQMAAFRGADVPHRTQAAFAVRAMLEGAHPEDLIAACGRLEVAERKEGESAFPSLGTLLRVAREVRTERERREAAADWRKQLDAYPQDAYEPMSRSEAKAFVERLRRDVEAKVRGLIGVGKGAA